MANALLAYTIYLILFVAINLAIFYHIRKFSYPGDATRLVLFLYNIVIIGIIVITFVLLGVI